MTDTQRLGEVVIDLKPTALWPEWAGKLTLDWPKPEIRWWRSAASPGFEVRSIVHESRFAASMPAWDDLVLSWKELRVLPPTWRARLAEWRGIYFVCDAKTDRGTSARPTAPTLSWVADLPTDRPATAATSATAA